MHDIETAIAMLDGDSQCMRIAQCCLSYVPVVRVGRHTLAHGCSYSMSEQKCVKVYPKEPGSIILKTYQIRYYSMSPLSLVTVLDPIARTT